METLDLAKCSTSESWLTSLACARPSRGKRLRSHRLAILTRAHAGSATDQSRTSATVALSAIFLLAHLSCSRLGGTNSFHDIARRLKKQLRHRTERSVLEPDQPDWPARLAQPHVDSRQLRMIVGRRQHRARVHAQKGPIGDQHAESVGDLCRDWRAGTSRPCSSKAALNDLRQEACRRRQNPRFVHEVGQRDAGSPGPLVSPAADHGQFIVEQSIHVEILVGDEIGQSADDELDVPLAQGASRTSVAPTLRAKVMRG